MVAQNQYGVLRQPVRKQSVRIDLLNEKDVVLDSFEGIATSGNINISAESTHRRSGNITMVLDKKYNLIPSPTSKIWFNKRCAIYVGVQDYSGETIWFNLGRFAMDEVDINLSASERTLSCQLKDYMAFLDGSLGGTLSHLTVIPAHTIAVNEALRVTLTGLTRFSIDDIEIDGSLLVVPYTIEKPAGSTIYDIVKELVELYAGYDFYFDENGYFIVEKIKDKVQDAAVEFFDGTNKDFSLNYTAKIDFKNVKNAVWVWGRQLEDGTRIKHVYRNRWTKLSIAERDVLVDREVGDICHVYDDNKSYAWTGAAWQQLDFNVVPNFNIEHIGEKVYVYSDNQIFSNEQAQLRAFFELKNQSNFAETINFSCVPLYSLGVNNKIHISIDGIINADYLVRSINIPLDIGSAMTVNATMIYY